MLQPLFVSSGEAAVSQTDDVLLFSAHHPECSTSTEEVKYIVMTNTGVVMTPQQKAAGFICSLCLSFSPSRFLSLSMLCLYAEKQFHEMQWICTTLS